MKFGQHTLSLDTPRIMGILNVTPDSFSDGGQFNRIESAIHQAELMVEQGAHIIDVGGESTRPGAKDVALEEELSRVIPVIEAITRELDIVVSIDTSKAGVMREAVAAGATLINDVRALREPEAMDTAASLGVPVCLMHMQGQPRTMQQSPEYDDVVIDVLDFLQARIDECVKAGIDTSQIIVDPGFGFGKSLEHNYRLLAKLEQFHKLGTPVLAGLSRKSMLGKLLDREVEERLAASVAVATIAAQKGAQIIRVHDVAETVDAVRIVNTVSQLSD